MKQADVRRTSARRPANVGQTSGKRRSERWETSGTGLEVEKAKSIVAQRVERKPREGWNVAQQPRGLESP